MQGLYYRTHTMSETTLWAGEVAGLCDGVLGAKAVFAIKRVPVSDEERKSSRRVLTTRQSTVSLMSERQPHHFPSQCRSLCCRPATPDVFPVCVLTHAVVMHAVPNRLLLQCHAQKVFFGGNQPRNLVRQSAHHFMVR